MAQEESQGAPQENPSHRTDKWRQNSAIKEQPIPGPLPIASAVFLLQNGNALKSRPAALRLKGGSSSGSGLVFAEPATATLKKMSVRCSREGGRCDTWRSCGGKNGLKITTLPADLQRPGLIVPCRLFPADCF